ncbi:1,2-phenylacetyl-CoA epoxidase subunit PaaE [Polycladidibacter hongkongensis]|uniref:1,2-phenylacetyl-CoA epoxidase subunit PaaE n=1 Tax=Polycladidibacter hongkongensis TaxID=1647556 RepID=UPI0008347E4B|nr:1,2-phenylacetyl-CoA epoxidase subunit PaaE [Pseudovibrio hongkongensis]
MARFHRLNVTAVEKTTRDAVVVTLQPQAREAQDFAFKQGQYLTFRQSIGGEEVRRSYSICSGVDDGVLQIGVKKVPGGVFSSFANDELKAGDTLEAMAPEGRFYTELQPDNVKSYLGFAVGSGITPILSIVKSTLAREPESEFTLVYANRSVGSIMFREELEDLKNTYMGRFTLIHVLKADAQEIDLFTGRLSPEKLEELFAHWVDVKAADTAFICGPEPVMHMVNEALQKQGMAREDIKFELFGTAATATPRPTDSASEAQGCEATIKLDGTARTVTMARQGVSMLEAALAADMDVPYSCKGGVCSTCKAKVLEGETEMVANYALEDYEVEAGYVLSCQCYPISERVVIDFDQ